MIKLSIGGLHVYMNNLVIEALSESFTPFQYPKLKREREREREFFFGADKVI
jgi:hypothetical protein